MEACCDNYSEYISGKNSSPPQFVAEKSGEEKRSVLMVITLEWGGGSSVIFSAIEDVPMQIQVRGAGVNVDKPWMRRGGGGGGGQSTRLDTRGISSSLGCIPSLAGSAH